MALKYLKNIEANLDNVLIITENFNIRDNNWNPTYFHHFIHTDIFMEITGSFNLRMSTLYIQVSTWYADNLNDSNSVINLMFLWANSIEINNHFILLDLWSSLYYAPLTVDIIIEEKIIQDKWQTIIKNSEKGKNFVIELKNAIGNINTFNISNI